MSNDIESPKGTTGDVPSEELQKLLEQIKSDKDAPEGLLELLQRMSEDPDIDKLLREKEEDTQRKELEAQELVEHIHTFFDEKGWHYTSMDPTGKLMMLGFRMRNSTIRLHVLVEPEVECIRFNISLFTCQEEYRMAMSQFIVETNKPLRYGAFHLDETDGEVTFRYSVSYRGLPFSPEAFEGYIDACTISADQNYKELGKIAHGRFDDEEKKKWFERIKQFAIALSQ